MTLKRESKVVGPRAPKQELRIHRLRRPLHHHPRQRWEARVPNPRARRWENLVAVLAQSVSQNTMMMQQVMVNQQRIMERLVENRSTEATSTTPLTGRLSQTTPGAERSTEPGRDRYMDMKWLPSVPSPSFKDWTTRSSEIAGYKGWLESFVSWIGLLHEAYAPEIREAVSRTSVLPMSLLSGEQKNRSQRVMYLLRQCFTGCSRVESIIRLVETQSPLGDRNGYEALRVISGDFCLQSRSEAQFYRNRVINLKSIWSHSGPIWFHSGSRIIQKIGCVTATLRLFVEKERGRRNDVPREMQ